MALTIPLTALALLIVPPALVLARRLAGVAALSRGKGDKGGTSIM
jgi:hypothetical protein